MKNGYSELPSLMCTKVFEQRSWQFDNFIFRKKSKTWLRYIFFSCVKLVKTLLGFRPQCWRLEVLINLFPVQMFLKNMPHKFLLKSDYEERISRKKYIYVENNISWTSEPTVLVRRALREKKNLCISMYIPITYLKWKCILQKSARQ